MPKPFSASTSSDLAFVRRVLIVGAIAALAACIWVLADILLLLFGSVLLALLLHSIAASIGRMFGMPERWALLLAGFLIVGVLAAGVVLLGPELARQMRALLEGLPQAFTRAADHLQLGSFADLLREGTTASSIGNLVSRMFAWSSTLLGGLASLVLVVFGGIYLAADPQLYRDGLIKLVPPSIQPNIEATFDDIAEALKRWLAGQLMAMALVGVLIALGLWAAGVPSAFALGFIAGLAEFVPLIGAIVAIVPALLIAGAQGPDTLLWALAVFVIVQQVESNLITPLIANRMVSVAPAVGLFAVVAMGILFGPLGLLFGFPLAVTLDVTVRRLYVQDTLGEDVEIMGEPAKPASDNGRAQG